MDLSTYLEGLLQKASIPPSELAHFLSEMRKTPSGALVTSKLLASKIQSSSETQAIRAFDLLEAALGLEVDGSIEFRTEVGRYRFLNELIRILSPKFYGTNTIPSVKERAIKFLTDAAGSKRRQWFPSEHSKINAVYNSLVDGGIILPNAADPDAEFQKSIFERGENAILLKKLLQSKDPSDLQAANRLIKNLVDEEAKRNERRSEIHSLIDRIETSTSLLTEMCSQTQIDREIVDDLATSCKSLRNRLGEIGTETNEETSSFLQASENIEKALAYYELRKNDAMTKHQIGDGLIEHPTPETKVLNTRLSLADELLIGMDLGPVVDPTVLSSNSDNHTESKDGLTNLLNFDFEEVNQVHPKVTNTMEEKRKRGAGGLEELSLISRQLMEESLMGREVSKPFAGEVRSTSHKITLSQLQKQTAPSLQLACSNSTNSSTILPNQPFSTTSHNCLLDLDFLEKPSPTSSNVTTSPQPIEDDKILLLHEKEDDGNKISTSILNEDLEVTEPNFSLDGILELDLENIEIFEDILPLIIPLDTISSSSRKELIELSFTFGTFPGFPRSLKLTVITLTNRNPISSLSDYAFQLLAPKGFQVKLFPPSGTELSPWKKRFLSPPLLTQVALILVPVGNQGKNSKEIKLKFVLSCYMGEETALFNSEFVLPTF